MPKSLKQKREGALYRLNNPTSPHVENRLKTRPRTEAQRQAEITRLEQLIKGSK